MGAISSLDELKLLVKEAKTNPVDFYFVATHPVRRSKEIRVRSTQKSWLTETHFHYLNTRDSDFRLGDLSLGLIDIFEKPRYTIFLNYWHAWAYLQKLKEKARATS